MAKINCSVQSCHFWGKNDVCKADNIMVNNNKSGNANMEVGSMQDAHANSSAETCCETFRSR
jgi:hypothetical protein